VTVRLQSQDLTVNRELWFLFNKLARDLPGFLRASLAWHPAGPMTAGVLAITANNAAFMTEIFRGALTSIPAGQIEAAASLGLKSARSWLRVILPQLYMRSLPAIVSECTIVVKGTALLAVITVVEVFRTANRSDSTSFRPFETFAAAGVVFLALSLASANSASGSSGAMRCVAARSGERGPCSISRSLPTTAILCARNLGDGSSYDFGCSSRLLHRVCHRADAHVRSPAAADCRWRYVEVLRNIPSSFCSSSSSTDCLFGDPHTGAIGGTIALAMFVSAYYAEILRGAMAAVPHGQVEAARAMGFTHPQILRDIIIPQMWKFALPPMAARQPWL